MPVPQVKNRRRILCVFPQYSRSFGTFHHAYQFFPDTRAFMPPQGILTIAAYLPKSWEVRVVDESVRPVTDDDLRWCDAVLGSGMHVQRAHLDRIADRAHAFGKICALGGSSVSAAPEYHPKWDILHVGEMGDATDKVIAHLDRTLERPAKQIVYETSERLPIDDFPIPSYDLIDFKDYMLVNIQWSSGCPYTCEFCDIPELYGRNPRYKSPERLIRELEAIVAKKPLGAVYFVDDNLIGNKKAIKQLLPHIIEWQKKNGYPLRFGAESTLNIATDKKLLELFREAYITDVFFGIESPDETTLESIDKEHNMRMPLLEAVKTINSYGIELHAGIILGLDNDKEDSAEKILKFIEDANIPLLAINVIYALPRTPLWRRLDKEGRLIPTLHVTESNVRFKLPAEVVMEQWRKVVVEAYKPDALYKRYRYNIINTYPNRKRVPLSDVQKSWPAVRMGLFALSTILVKVGMRSHYRAEFWQMARELAAEGRIDHLIYIGALAHHLIQFGEDVASGLARACFYTERQFDDAHEDAVPKTTWERWFKGLGISVSQQRKKAAPQAWA